MAIPDATTITVIDAMKTLIRRRYDNLLTDNGSQFSRANAEMRKYCDEWLNEKQIWSSIHHPQTLGKLSVFQKGLKRFLRHRIGKKRNISEINHWIDVYDHWYNNGCYHSSIKTYPETRYSGDRQENWYEKLITALKLDNVLTMKL
jgi:transposase InsO family protein